jgi:hypothetical protein
MLVVASPDRLASFSTRHNRSRSTNASSLPFDSWCQVGVCGDAFRTRAFSSTEMCAVRLSTVVRTRSGLPRALDYAGLDSALRERSQELEVETRSSQFVLNSEPRLMDYLGSRIIHTGACLCRCRHRHVLTASPTRQPRASFADRLEAARSSRSRQAERLPLPLPGDVSMSGAPFGRFNPISRNGVRGFPPPVSVPASPLLTPSPRGRCYPVRRPRSAQLTTSLPARHTIS